MVMQAIMGSLRRNGLRKGRYPIEEFHKNFDDPCSWLLLEAV